ncbi:hypothetical protein BKA66DRAFT_299245 [Pyrenochaeta sp. MPI-SDFR-AT-0127]|nr:hypothetical protein BKA66DRAFT_299245 [Pyrenochaeta sp. MPI-SDFR-AT-0127]
MKRPRGSVTNRLSLTDSNASDGSLPKAIQSLGDWPLEPRTLQTSASSWLIRLLPHVVLLLIPVASVGLGISVLRINGHAESNIGNSLVQAMAVISTLWPILFAAVLGPMLKAVALHFAARGARLGILEILSSSQTLVSAFRGGLTFRFFTWLSLGLTVVWSLSPIGGQGALRALELRENRTTYEYPIASFPHTNLSVFTPGPFEGSSTPAYLLNQFRALNGAVFSAQDVGLLHANGSSPNFESAVQRAGGAMEAVKSTRRDLWRNVRIPFLHSFSKGAETELGWVDVPSDTIPDYSSLIGVPVRGLPRVQRGNTTFMISSFYQTLECTPWRNSSEWIRLNNDSLTLRNRSALYPSGYPLINFDILYNRKRPNTGSWGSLSGWNFTEPSEKMTIVAYNIWNLTLCNLTTHYVDSQISCSRPSTNGDLGCSVTKMRRTPQTTDMGNLTALDVGWTNVIVKHIPYTLASLHVSDPGILEKWLRDPPTAFRREYPSIQTLFDEVPMQVFSDRLALVLNTHLRATFNVTINVGSDGTSIDARDSTWANTTGTWSEFTAPVYSVRRLWFTLYFTSAIVLTICAMCNLVLRIYTNVPDIFGSISALTRDSIYFDMPTPASTMDGIDRARSLPDKWVMIQDVAPDEAVGRIAFSDASTCVPLRKDRMYI